MKQGTNKKKEKKMNKEYTYITKFTLTNLVLDLESANDYLTEDDMVDYFDEYKEIGITEDLVKKVISINWELQTRDSGKITVKTNALLTDEESKAVSKWISEQNSDGLGEGFEQQDFADYDVNRYDYDGNEINIWDLDDDYEEYWVMASFDWQTNDYELELQA